MKKVLSLIMAALLLVGIAGCSSDPNGSKAGDDFPIVGVWKAEDDDIYWRIQSGGEMTQEFVLVNKSTRTVNGVTTSSTSKSLSTASATWEIKNGDFIFDGTATFEMKVDGSEYKLVNGKLVYVRVGDVDYEIPLDGEESDGASAEDAIKYTVGESISAEGIEMTFTESGFSDDIRVTSASSGIRITSGPSPEDGKEFFYLKGTLKNTGKEEIRPAIGGTVTLDGYKYDIAVDTISANGSPCLSIEPLDTVTILIFAHIPAELSQSFSSGEMIFGFNDNFAAVDITNCDHLYSVAASRNA